VGLGTDGAFVNNSNDLFGEMKTLALLHKLNSVFAQFALSSTGNGYDPGATVFGIQNETGSWRGEMADIYLLQMPITPYWRRSVEAFR